MYDTTTQCPQCQGPHTLDDCPRWRERSGYANVLAQLRAERDNSVSHRRSAFNFVCDRLVALATQEAATILGADQVRDAALAEAAAMCRAQRGDLHLKYICEGTAFAIESLKRKPAAAPESAEPSAAARDVLAERQRQTEVEEMTNDGDDKYHHAELPRAAAAYILNGANDEAPYIWPWAKSWWKPRDVRRNYVRAAALLLAEIERLDRAASSVAKEETA
jgi:hypothetical protein